MKPIIIQGAESSEIDYLIEKLENKEYVQIKNMATKTVESTGGLKIIGNNSNADIKNV